LGSVLGREVFKDRVAKEWTQGIFPYISYYTLVYVGNLGNDVTSSLEV
jgi:hypothetical protein